MTVKGKIENIQAPIELKNFCLEGVEYPLVHKSFVDLTLSHYENQKMRIEGSAKLSLLIPCNRCLEEVETPFEIHIDKDIDFRQKEDDRIGELDETNYLSGYNLDVDLLVYDEILLDFPMKVLCDEDCKGLCKVCGTNLNKSSCSCDNTAGDPRMSVIRDIFNNFKEV
jgi:Predicted metal-binding, possibly nucleic acid-binding protein